MVYGRGASEIAATKQHLHVQNDILFDYIRLVATCVPGQNALGFVGALGVETAVTNSWFTLHPPQHSLPTKDQLQDLSDCKMAQKLSLRVPKFGIVKIDSI
jgi:hypothetical protein